MFGPLSVLLQIFVIVLLMAGIAYLLYQTTSMFIFPEDANEDTPEEGTSTGDTPERAPTEPQSRTRRADSSGASSPNNSTSNGDPRDDDK